MYLTRMELDTSRRTTMKALAAPTKLHGAIESSFPGERQRNLWRIDKVGNKHYLMLLSREKPDLTHAYEQFGDPAHEPVWETRDYNTLLDKIQNGSRWHFRLVACPVKSVSRNEGADQERTRGKVYGHVTIAQKKEWLQSRAEKNGFSLEEDQFDVVRSSVKKFFKGTDKKPPVTLATADFEGHLTVTNAELFRKALEQGIGRGKAYGLGLLTIVRPH